MKKIFILLLALTLAISLSGCSKLGSENVFEKIKHSSSAKIELPDGSSAYIDGKIALLRSFAGLNLIKTSFEPNNNESDWIYRIVFNPSEKVKCR